jgi:uncharacterized protein YceK
MAMRNSRGNGLFYRAGAKVRPWLRCMTLMAGLAALGGCTSTLLTLDAGSHESKMFVGTRNNADLIFGSDACHGFLCFPVPLIKTYAIIDLVPSLALDTVFLPYTAPHDLWRHLGAH